MQIVRDFSFVVNTVVNDVQVELGETKSMREAESLVLRHLDTNPKSEVRVSTYISRFDIFAGPEYVYHREGNKVLAHVEQR